MTENQIDQKIEEYVTYKVADYLSHNDWGIISCNPPGGHGGICLLDKDRSKGGIVPDIIAKKENYILVIESKPFFSSGVSNDIAKLEGLTHNHVANLAQRLNLGNKWLKKWQFYLQKAVAVKTIKNEEVDKVPSSYIIFVTNDISGKIQTIIKDSSIIKKLI